MFNKSFACLSLAILPLLGCQATSTTNASTTNNSHIEQKQIMQQAKKPNTNNSLQNILTNYQWQLQSATDGKGQPITILNELHKSIKLHFTQNKQGLYYGFGLGCNTFGATIKMQGNTIIPSNMLNTLMLCDEVDKAEKKLTKVLGQSSKLTMMPMSFLPQPSMANKEKAMLQQVTADGSTLIWQGTLTDTAKYGKGERIFLEVAPKTAKCSSGINGQCLQVRDVYYDNKGIKTGVGKWRLMSKTIKGYTHNPNLRQVLRLKKYVTDPVDVKGKQIVYAFDMAVETEFLNIK